MANMNLRIETIENGWIVYIDEEMGIMGRRWVFDDADILGEFITDWAATHDYHKEPQA